MMTQGIPLPVDESLRLPRMVPVRQTFERPQVADVGEEIARQFAAPHIRAAFRPGASIAVGCGSRGVANAAAATSAVVSAIKSLGCHPFLFPAMGSHGAATAQGQVEVLRGYGISEQTMQCPVRATMDTVVVGQLSDGTPVHMDAFAAQADGVVLINRIKPHTNFRAPWESGIVKMMGVGMGKIAGAAALHRHGMDRFHTVLPDAARVVLGTGTFLLGVGLVENALEETALVEVIPADRLLAREAELQELAKSLMGRLKFDELDVLVIDEIGKSISGTCADPNVTGRNVRGVEWDVRPALQKIVMLGFTAGSDGNATGVGAADVITARLFNDMDLVATYTNVLTSGGLDAAAIPLIAQTDRLAISVGLLACSRVTPHEARVVRIRDTLSLDTILVSESLLPVVQADPAGFEVLGPAADFPFDDDGRITPFSEAAPGPRDPVPHHDHRRTP